MHFRTLVVVVATSIQLVIGAVQPSLVHATDRSYVVPDDDPNGHAGQVWSTDDAGNFWRGDVDAKPVARYQPTNRGIGRPAVDRWYDLVDQYDWPTSVALRVVQCESKGDPTAVNPSSGAAGLFQLLGWESYASRLFGRWVSLFDPAVNTRVAHDLYVDSGHRFGFHWAASMGCWG